MQSVVALFLFSVFPIGCNNVVVLVSSGLHPKYSRFLEPRRKLELLLMPRHNLTAVSKEHDHDGQDYIDRRPSELKSASGLSQDVPTDHLQGMPYLNRHDGVRLYYEAHGSGPPLILSHGYSSTSAMWQGQIDNFTTAGYQLIIWDMRGHGQSSYPEDQSQYSEAHTVSDIAALLDHVCGADSKAIVGGLSLGGYMSLAFYRVHPTRVKVLLIIDTGPGFKSDKARDAWNQTAKNTGARFDKDGLSALQADGVSPERSLVTHRNATGLARAARGMLAQQNAAVIGSLLSVKVPALIVVGGDDTPFLVASEYMAKKIPGARKVVIPNAGHAANIDQPNAFNEAVLSFLAQVGGGNGSNGRAML